MTENTQPDPAEDVTDDDGQEPVYAVKLTLDGDEVSFTAAKQYANKFLLVKLMPEMDHEGFRSMNAVTRLVESQVADEDRPRLAEYLELHGFSDDYVDGLFASLVECWKGETFFPSQPSADSSGTTSTDATGD